MAYARFGDAEMTGDIYTAYTSALLQHEYGLKIVLTGGVEASAHASTTLAISMNSWSLPKLKEAIFPVL